MSWITLEYFMKKNKLKKVINHDEDVMDISPCKCCMNSIGTVFNVKDEIVVNGKRRKILGFSAHDDDWFGAIVLMDKENGIAKWVRLENMENQTYVDSIRGKIEEILYEYQFKFGGDNGYVRNRISVDIDYEDGTASVWRENREGTEYFLMKENLTKEQLRKVLAVIERRNTWMTPVPEKMLKGD